MAAAESLTGMSVYMTAAGGYLKRANHYDPLWQQAHAAITCFCEAGEPCPLFSPTRRNVIRASPAPALGNLPLSALPTRATPSDNYYPRLCFLLYPPNNYPVKRIRWLSTLNTTKP
jgi:hypothetical protein